MEENSGLSLVLVLVLNVMSCNVMSHHVGRSVTSQDMYPSSIHDWRLRGKGKEGGEGFWHWNITSIERMMLVEA